jgi:uncharacterized membrane protein YhhN
MLEVPVLVLSLLLGLVYFRFLGKRASHGWAALKTAPVLLLAVYAAIAGGPTWLVMALFLGALGDLCLAYDGERAFIAGLVSFLLSHIAYVALFWPMGEPSLILSEAWRIGSAAALAILVPALILVLWRPAGPLAMPVAIYGLVIGAMGFTALSVADAAVFLGAALFLSSDTALAAEKFLVGAAAPPGRLLRNFVWATYYAAQLVFTLAVAGPPSA